MSLNSNLKKAIEAGQLEEIKKIFAVSNAQSNLTTLSEALFWQHNQFEIVKFLVPPYQKQLQHRINNYNWHEFRTTHTHEFTQTMTHAIEKVQAEIFATLVPLVASSLFDS